MTTNPHEAADTAHVRIKALCSALEQDLHQTIKSLDNRAALAGHWQGVADAQRGEIERLRVDVARLQSENANLSAHLETVASERDELMRRVRELEQKIKKEAVLQ